MLRVTEKNNMQICDTFVILIFHTRRSSTVSPLKQCSGVWAAPASDDVTFSAFSLPVPRKPIRISIGDIITRDLGILQDVRGLTFCLNVPDDMSTAAILDQVHLTQQRSEYSTIDGLKAHLQFRCGHDICGFVRPLKFCNVKEQSSHIEKKAHIRRNKAPTHREKVPIFIYLFAKFI